MTAAGRQPDQVKADRRAQAAARQRRRRERRRAGARVYPVEGDRDLVERLVERRFLHPEDVADDAKIALALSMLLETFLEKSGVTRDGYRKNCGTDDPEEMEGSK